MSYIQLNAKQQVYQRLRMVKEMDARRESVTAIARKYGMSRKTAYKWFTRWDAGDREICALAENSRAPRSSPRRLPPTIVACIVSTAQAHPDLGLVRPTRALQRQGNMISVYGVYRTLIREGIVSRAHVGYGASAINALFILCQVSRCRPICSN